VVPARFFTRRLVDRRDPAFDPLVSTFSRLAPHLGRIPTRRATVRQAALERPGHSRAPRQPEARR
jgi:hypothetical protein